MKKLLVVVDMQNDFISGSLGTTQAQEAAGKPTILMVGLKPHHLLFS